MAADEGNSRSTRSTETDCGAARSPGSAADRSAGFTPTARSKASSGGLCEHVPSGARVNPPWNQPHVTFAAVNRSPMLRPVMAAGLACEHTSQNGSVSSTNVPSCPLVGGRRRRRRRGRAALRHVAVHRRLWPAHHAVGVARGEVQRAARRLAGHGREAVVAEREVLRVVPVGGDRVAVEVAHHRVPLAGDGLVTELTRVRRRLGAEAGVLVHQPAVPRALLVRILVVLVAGVRLQPVDAELLEEFGLRSSKVGVRPLTDGVSARAQNSGCPGGLRATGRRDTPCRTRPSALLPHPISSRAQVAIRCNGGCTTGRLVKQA